MTWELMAEDDQHMADHPFHQDREGETITSAESDQFVADRNEGSKGEEDTGDIVQDTVTYFISMQDKVRLDVPCSGAS